MSINQNSANRILSILENSKELTLGPKVMDVWVRVFGIEENNKNKISFEVTRSLILFQEEIEYLRAKMEVTEFSQDLYNPFLDQIIAIIAVKNLEVSWKSYEGNISKELLLCLKFLREVLPADEIEIPEEEIKRISELVANLEAQLSSSNLSPFLINNIKKHIVNIKRALENYNIVGSKAFSDVMTSAYGEVFQNPEIFTKEKDSEEVKLLGKIWKKAQEISNKGGVIEKGLSTAEKLSTRASEALENFSNIIQ